MGSCVNGLFLDNTDRQFQAIGASLSPSELSSTMSYTFIGEASLTADYAINYHVTMSEDITVAEGLITSIDRSVAGITQFDQDISEGVGVETAIQAPHFVSLEDLFENGELIFGSSATGFIDESQSFGDETEHQKDVYANVFEDLTWEIFSQVSLINRVLETFNYADTATGAREILLLISDEVGLSDILKVVFPQYVLEDLTYTDQIEVLVGALVTIVDGILYNHVTLHQSFLNASAESGISLIDLARLIELISESVNLLDVEDAHRLLKVSTPELFTFEEDIDVYASVFVVSEEDINVDDFTLPQLITNGMISEDIEFIIGDNLLGVEYSAWVLNPENTAVSNYDMSFTLSCTFNQDSLFANSDGLFKFGGTTDDGEDINSSITTASVDFGTSALKSVNKMYLETNSNELTVIARIENRYSARYRMKHSDDFLGLRMIDLGKGLKGYLWQFRLQNVDNSEFDIDSMELLPMILRRKR